MPTPDEVYEQVLADEQAKGSSPAVAQARAKAARVRAQRGSANPAKPDSSTAPAPQRGERAAASGQQPAVEQPAAEAAPRPAATARPAAERSPGSPSQTGAPARRAAGNGTAAVPERVQRLLAVVKPEAIQKVERQPMDRVNVWPHLMAAEAMSLFVVMAVLSIFSTAVDAPLRDLANFNQTPN